jgi:uncharacterized protein (DUF433 family)
MESNADIVVSDPAVLGGEPVFRGTRVPVQALIDCLAAGDSVTASWMTSPPCRAMRR